VRPVLRVDRDVGGDRARRTSGGGGESRLLTGRLGADPRRLCLDNGTAPLAPQLVEGAVGNDPLQPGLEPASALELPSEAKARTIPSWAPSSATARFATMA
jgi:hypothetical protein